MFECSNMLSLSKSCTISCPNAVAGFICTNITHNNVFTGKQYVYNINAVTGIYCIWMYSIPGIGNDCSIRVF